MLQRVSYRVFFLAWNRDSVVDVPAFSFWICAARLSFVFWIFSFRRLLLGFFSRIFFFPVFQNKIFGKRRDSKAFVFLASYFVFLRLLDVSFRFRIVFDVSVCPVVERLQSFELHFSYHVWASEPLDVVFQDFESFAPLDFSFVEAFRVFWNSCYYVLSSPVESRTFLALAFDSTVLHCYDSALYLSKSFLVESDYYLRKIERSHVSYNLALFCFLFVFFAVVCHRYSKG